MCHREFEMKTLKISDEVHGKLTAVLGELMAKTGKMKTYQDAIDAVLNKSVILPEDLLNLDKITGTVEIHRRCSSDSDSCQARAIHSLRCRKAIIQDFRSS